MAESTVVVDNFAAWRKSIVELDTGLDKEMKRGLKTIGVKVSKRAKEWARAQGLRASGELIKRISSSSTANSVAVTSKAQRLPSDGSRSKGKPSRYAGKNFLYPAVYEFGGRAGAGVAGPRAFLTPAVKASEALIRDELGKVIDEVSRKAGFH